MIRSFLSLQNWIVPALLGAVALFSGCSESKTTADNASPVKPAEISPQPSTGQTASAPSAAQDRFFAAAKPVPAASTNIPQTKGDISFTIDILGVRDKVVRIRGWAFRLTPPHQPGDRVKILLVGPAKNYSADAEVESRPDVSAVLKQPGMDDTGFVSLISVGGIEPGEYTLFLEVGGADGEAIKSTNRTLTL